jgi:hypothetical protein
LEHYHSFFPSEVIFKETYIGDVCLGALDFAYLVSSVLFFIDVDMAMHAKGRQRRRREPTMRAQRDSFPTRWSQSYMEPTWREERNRMFSQPGYIMGAVGLHINHAQGTVALIGGVDWVCELNIVSIFFNAEIVIRADIRGEHTIVNHDNLRSRRIYRTTFCRSLLTEQNYWKHWMRRISYCSPSRPSIAQ